MPKTTKTKLYARRDFWDREWGEREAGAQFSIHMIPIEELKGKSILEVGGGALQFSVAQYVTGGVVNADFSGVALRQGRENAPDSAAVQADAKRLPFKDNAFDVVIAAEILPLMGKGAIAALKEIRRVTKHRVIFTMSYAGSWTKNPAAQKDITRLEHGVIYTTPDSANIFMNEDDVRGLLMKIGLKPVKVQALSDSELNNICTPPSHHVHIYPDEEKVTIYVEAVKMPNKRG